MQTRSTTLEAAIKAEARALGFVQCGIARADAIPGAGARLDEWLLAGSHGSMGWMEARAAERGSPPAFGPRYDRW